MHLARVFRWALVACLLAAPAAGETLEFLYVEPNVGVASGGHVALRIGDRVHHFHHAEGLLRASRDDIDEFRYVYSVLQNRTIHVARIDADDASWQAVRARFNLRSFVERQHFAVRRSLVADRRLLQASVRGESRAPIRLRGAGYFFDEGGESGSGEQPRIAAMRGRLRRDRGETWARIRIADLDAAIGALDPAAFPPPELSLLPDRAVAHAPGLADRFTELTLQRHALLVIDGALPLRDDALLSLDEPAYRLTVSERRALTRYARRIEEDVVELLDAPRPDWGYPMLASLARLAALGASLESGRLRVLDVWPADALRMSAESLHARAAYIAELREAADSELAGARTEFADAERPGERHYQRLEEATNRHFELARGRAERWGVRLHGDRLIPSGVLGTSPGWAPATGSHRSTQHLTRAVKQERDHRAALHAAYGYDLILRNCVTEILDLVAAETGHGLVEVPTGEHGGGSTALRFWPPAAFANVARGAREVGEIQSYRRAALIRMSEAEHPLRVHLREASTLTSTIYRSNPRDSFFLFFTRDRIFPRPLYGAANLLAGAGQTLVGAFQLPFDGGDSLNAGLRGMLFSLPELAFVSIRKGTLEYAPASRPRTEFQRH